MPENIGTDESNGLISGGETLINNDATSIVEESRLNLSSNPHRELTELEKKQIKELFKDSMIKEVQEIKKDFLTIFGLFASFVTFLSIEVQLFKTTNNIFELVGISSLSLSFVMFFALIINEITKDKIEWKDFLKPTYILNFGFAVVGIIFLFLKNPNDEFNKLKSDVAELKNINIDSVKISNPNQIKNSIIIVNNLSDTTSVKVDSAK